MNVDSNKKIFDSIDKIFNVFVNTDVNGLPSNITVDGESFCLQTSVDRHHFRIHVERILVKSYIFSDSESKIISDLYCGDKYSKYKQALMAL
jgi:hypothetical protein